MCVLGTILLDGVHIGGVGYLSKCRMYLIYYFWARFGGWG